MPTVFTKSLNDPVQSKPGTMEDYVIKLLGDKQSQLNCFTWSDYGNVIYGVERFHALAAQVDILYIILTGHNNPLSNPRKQKMKPYRHKTDQELGLKGYSTWKMISGGIILFFAVIGLIHSCNYVVGNFGKRGETPPPHYMHPIKFKS